MSAPHTPGPWRVNYSHFGQVVTKDGMLIANCAKASTLSVLQANAYLIAAAPEMLAALRMVIANLEAGGDEWGMLAELRALVERTQT